MQAKGKGSLLQYWQEIVGSFLKLGAMSYGGPAIMGIMQVELQEKRQWLSKPQFLEGLSLVSMLPGAGATQLGMFLGYARGGWWGALLAGICFALPALVIMLMLTLAYAALGATPAMRGAFYGLSPIVLAIFVVAAYRLRRNAIVDWRQIAIVIAAMSAAAWSRSVPRASFCSRALSVGLVLREKGPGVFVDRGAASGGNGPMACIPGRARIDRDSNGKPWQFVRRRLGFLSCGRVHIRRRLDDDRIHPRPSR